MITQRFNQHWLMKEMDDNTKRALCDSESHLGFGLFKNVSFLSLSHTIKFFAYRAVNENKLLMIKVPESCELSPGLIALKGSLLTSNGQELIRILRLK